MTIGQLVYCSIGREELLLVLNEVRRRNLYMD